ncbi:myeloid-associated differentiation marker-like [Gastrophryne carolinensis]
MDVRSLISPLLIIRFFQIFLSCTAFSLVASVGMYHNQYGTWSMFTWILAFVVTIVIVVLELTGFASKLPISWEDFTSAFSMLASLMLLTTSIMYPAVFLNGGCSGHSCACRGAATAMSILCFFAYAIEVGITRAKPGEISGFLSTIPGLLKVFESYVACIIFSLLPTTDSPGLQWCIAVYSICFIITTLIILMTIGRILPRLPVNFERILIGYNILAVAMYITVAVIWPYYFFKIVPDRSQCGSNDVCLWDNGVGITILTYINLVAYSVDTFYSFRMVFFTVPA